MVLCKIFSDNSDHNLQDRINRWIETERKKQSSNSAFKIIETRYAMVAFSSCERGGDQEIEYSAMFLYYEANGRPYVGGGDF